VGNTDAVDLATRYLAFTWYAFNTETKRFRNFMDYQRNWLEESGSDDSHGRALWAFGIVLGRSNIPALHNMAGRIFQQSLLAILETTSPRAWAFALIGIHDYLERFDGDSRVSQVQNELAERLLKLYLLNRKDGWHWFEDKLTYCNAALAHAMLLCGESIPNSTMTEAGKGWSRPAWMLSVLLERKAGTGKPAAPSNGFSDETTYTSWSMTQPQAAVVMACILIG
jgi:hypothetical protein